MTPTIEIEDLDFTYDDGTRALEGVNFRLNAGETVAVLGANGSGKTTFALQLNGLLRGSGSIRVCGMPLTRETLPAIRSKIGLVFQDSDEQLFMPTVLEDVAFGPLNAGLAVDQAIEKAKQTLQQVGMEYAHDKAPYHLSAGEKRRVALAGVLAMDPEILILDEPTVFLDPPGQRKLLQLLQSLPQAKLLVTHDVTFASALATRAVFFDKGKLVSDGPLEEIVRKFDWIYPFPGDAFRYSAQRRF
jgi:cobalt/nickel transport system ATP-binding protein